MDLILPSGRSFDADDLEIIEEMHAAGTVRWSDTSFNLKSGGTSHVYFMGREDLTLNPGLMHLVADKALGHIWNCGVRDCCLIGVPSAGTAIAAAMSAINFYNHEDEEVKYLVMRQVLKKHGNNPSWLDGKPPEDTPLITVENVRTTGASEEEAIARMEQDGIDTSHVIRLALVDRRLRAETDTRKSVFYMADIVTAFGHLGLWNDEQVGNCLPEFLEVE